jgi:hypothetical protein
MHEHRLSGPHALASNFVHYSPIIVLVITSHKVTLKLRIWFWAIFVNVNNNTTTAPTNRQTLP